MKFPFVKNIPFVIMFLLINTIAEAQTKQDSIHDYTGFLSMGARNCISVFSTNGKSFVGVGAGGQFGLRIAKNFNSHWFADWIVSNIDNLAQRVDFHSGFSMMPEVFAPRIGKIHISLFPLAGICIDYTKFSITSGKNISSGPGSVDRYSFAVQAGLGTTVPVSKRLDFSIEAHYMVHIGTDVDIEMNGSDEQLIRKQGTNLEGHFVLALSMDFKLFRLWQKKQL